MNQNETKLSHGGDWAGFAIEYGTEPLDFSMNVNPLGIAPEVQQAIAKAGASADRYPDPLCRALVQRLADYEGIPSDLIFCGNGAADIIFRLAQVLGQGTACGTKDSRSAAGAGRESVSETSRIAAGAGRAPAPARRPVLLITAPTFSEYATAFAGSGWEVRRYRLREKGQFRIEEDILKMIGEDTDAVFLCEPNNPTGVVTERQILQEIMQRCRETGTWLVVDECFNGFLADSAAVSMKRNLQNWLRDEQGGGLIILKAFTKLYGMAGVRLGYCLCSSEEVVGRLRAAGPPWNVSSLAQAAGIAALDAPEHAARGVKIVQVERPWMKEQLQRLGIRQVYGEANYLLFHIGADDRPDSRGGAETQSDGSGGVETQTDGSGGAMTQPTDTEGAKESTQPLHEQLRRRGILIRDCSNYEGLGEGWYRIAVRKHEENRRLIEALSEALAE